MNLSLLIPEIQQFIDSKIGMDSSKLALQKNPFPDCNWIEIVNQIAAKTKAKTKLPSFFKTENIIYPSKISVEQTSSEKTAQHKSSLVSGDCLIDLTGGFGVDAYFFSKKVKKVIHCEMNPELSEIVTHNFKTLKADTIKCYSGDSLTILKSLNTKVDWIYIDPSRRNETKGKVFMLKDCMPNVPELLSTYFEYTSNILIKTAPILDLSAGLLELKNVKNIHIVAVDNEVKELLWELVLDYNGIKTIKTINITNEATFEFDFELHSQTYIPTFSLPKRYLFEPNSAIMKSGGFDAISEHYKIDKLHPHSHLYTADEIIDFPGRTFEIQHCFPYNKLEMKKHLEHQKANVTTRNFSESVETIRKKWKIKEGGTTYCFFTTDCNNNKIVLIGTKI